MSASGRPLHMYLFQENLRYDKIAEALGARGEYVTRPEDFMPALKRSYDIAAKDRISTVINCQAKREYWQRAQFEPGMLGKVEPGCMAYSH
jgi:thiamine pyrophosphate-dependent acetolactate synthase large subunit-like protein